jgi:hypothetical protein
MIFNWSGRFPGRTATSPSNNFTELSPIPAGLGGDAQREPRLVVREFAVVMDFADGKVIGR